MGKSMTYAERPSAWRRRCSLLTGLTADSAGTRARQATFAERSAKSSPFVQYSSSRKYYNLPLPNRSRAGLERLFGRPLTRSAVVRRLRLDAGEAATT